MNKFRLFAILAILAAVGGCWCRCKPNDHQNGGAAPATEQQGAQKQPAVDAKDGNPIVFKNGEVWMQPKVDGAKWKVLGQRGDDKVILDELQPPK